MTYKTVRIRPTPDFSIATLKAGKQRRSIFKVLKEKNLESRSLYPPKLSFNMTDGPIYQSL